MRVSLTPMRRLLLSLAFLAPFPVATSLPAQHASAYGAVSGTVSCVDTNLPARLISITLQPVPPPPNPTPAPAEAKTAKDQKAEKEPTQMLSIHQTHLDGTFFIPRVAPGRYYVIAQKPGYLSPVAQYSREEVEHPTAEMRKILAETLPNVTVSANQTAAIDIRLTRGASISGTILFDDGTPAPDLQLEFKRKDKDGKWVAANLGGHIETDDLGHFHAGGLPAAEYQIHTSLALMETIADHIFGGMSGYAISPKQNIDVFYGDTFFERDAKTLKIEGSEDATADFDIPISKLHSLSGTLVDARTGHVINAGTLEFFLKNPDGTEAKIASAWVDEDEPTFRVEFIPEGEYTLRVSEAKDVTREEVALCNGCFGTRQFKETVVKKYGLYEAPYVVQTDAVGVTLSIPALKPGTSTPTSDPQ